MGKMEGLVRGGVDGRGLQGVMVGGAEGEGEVEVPIISGRYIVPFDHDWG